jgi:hypothetical protein
LLGFNVDPDFANVLDVLIMVDLRQTPRHTLMRYLGADGTKAFINHHQVSDAQPSGLAPGTAPRVFLSDGFRSET